MSAQQKKPDPRPRAVTRNEAANDSRFSIHNETDDGKTKGNLTMLAVGIVGVSVLVAILAVAGHSLGNLLFTLGELYGR